MTGRTTGHPATEPKENTVTTVPTPDHKRAARRTALRFANSAFLVLALLITAAGVFSGPWWVLSEGIALLLLALAVMRSDYRGELRSQIRLAESQAQLARIEARREQILQRAQARNAPRHA